MAHPGHRPGELVRAVVDGLAASIAVVCEAAAGDPARR